MNPKLIPCLQKIFWIIGCAILVFGVVNMGALVFAYFNPPMIFDTPIGRNDFRFLSLLRGLFSTLGQAFFAFLVSSIFDMVFHRAPVRSQQTETFLTIACIGFVGEGLLGLVSWVQYLFIIVTPLKFVEIYDYITLVSYIIDLFPHVISLIYAISIYILYQHFSRMVAFESEVI